MANALDYLKWRGDLSFDVSPFNEVDMFLCSSLSTPDYSGIVNRDDKPISIEEMAERYFNVHSMNKTENIGVLQSNYILPAFKEMALSERFKDIKLWKPETKIVMENAEQFSAVTVCFQSGARLISIKGTDDTIIGWEEDFRIAFNECVPAQQDALEYLTEVANECPESDLYLCGHSKGGNLAVYAAAMAPESIQRRIKYVVNYDGPGFREDFLEHDGYKQIKDKIYTVLSQNSMIGTLLNRVGNVEYVKSNEQGPMAHDGFSWQVMGKNFIRADGLSEASMNFENAMKYTLAGMNDEEMAEFTDALFSALLSTDARTIREISLLPVREKYDVLRRLRGKERVTRFVRHVLLAMAKSLGNEIMGKY